jgi:hypothetical protein
MQFKNNSKSVHYICRAREISREEKHERELLRREREAAAAPASEIDLREIARVRL